MAISMLDAGLCIEKSTKSENAVISMQHKDYELNIEKSLCKKLAASKRVQHLNIEVKDGGTVLTADAAMFELVREAAVIYYKNYPQKFGQAKIETVTDSSKKNIVQHIIRVYSEDLNIYLTTSRLMVNGKKAALFVERDIHEMQKIIKEATCKERNLDLGKLNDFIAKQINKALSLKQGNVTEGVKNLPIQEENIKCKKCGKNCRKRSSYCSLGQHWVHYNCERLDEAEIRAIEMSKPDEQYTCKLCSPASDKKSCLSIPSIGNSSTNHAHEILTEEIESCDSSINTSENFCFVCENKIDQTDSEICDYCNCPCHAKCGYPNGGTFICIHCDGCEDQNNADGIELNNSNLSSSSVVQLDGTADKTDQVTKSQNEPDTSGNSDEIVINHDNQTISQSMVNQNMCRPENKYKNEQNQMTGKSNQSSKSQTKDTDLTKILSVLN